MRTSLAVQAVASLVVLGCFIAAEWAARALEADPTSPTLWFLHLEVFGFMSHARNAHSPVAALFQPASLWVALSLVAGVVAAALAKRPMIVAYFANGAFLFVVALGCAYVGNSGSLSVAASLQPAVLASRPDVWPILILAAATSVGFVASRWTLVRSVRDTWRRSR